MAEIPPEIENEMKIKPVPKMPEFRGGIQADIAQSDQFNAAEKAILCGVDEIKQICRFIYWSHSQSIEQSRAAEFELRLKVRRLWNGIFAVSLVLVGALATALFSYMANRPHL